MRDLPLSLEGVGKIYGSGPSAVNAVEQVNLDVHSDELLLLMGPSGSGKTTLLSIMGCILRPTSGAVRVWGEDTSRLSERQLPRIRRRHIGFVFQAFNLFPALTAGENVELALDVKRVRGSIRARAAELLAEVGLEHKYHALPADLSGGQKQRVAIARALGGDPGIILADEPTAALDSHSGVEIMRLLQGLAHERGRAVAVVSHDPRMVSFADRIVQVRDGKLVPRETAVGIAVNC
jgi:putative ABC transport system ATP-binding protein